MKTSGVRLRGLLCPTFVAVMVLFSCLNRGQCQVSVKLITLQATVKDTSGHPVQGATIVVTDKNKAAVEDPYLNLFFSGKDGETNAQVPAVSATYFVTIYAEGYFSPSAQKVSGLHDANLKFVLKKNPKYIFVRPVALPNYMLQIDFSVPTVVQKTGVAVQKTVTVSITPVNGFRRSIHLSMARLPAGLSATVQPAVISTQSRAVLSSTARRDVHSQLVFHVAPTIRPGEYKVDLLSTPTGSQHTRHYPFSLRVSPAVQDTQFRIAQSEQELEILPGGPARTVTLTLHPGTGFQGPVKLHLQNDPKAPLLDTPTFSQNTLDADHPVSTLTFRLGPHAAEGFHNLLITATASTGTQTLLLPVSVLPYTGGVPAPATERPEHPAPLPTEGPEGMIRHDMNGTKDKPTRHNP